MECFCCGEDRDPSRVAALTCHEAVKVCRDCVGGLRSQLGVPDSTPILPVRNVGRATAFYEAAGFDVRPYDDGFAFVSYADESVFDLDLAEQIDPETNGAGCFIIVPNADAWHGVMGERGLPVSSIEDMPWAMREFTLTDPDGNHIRIGHSI